MTKNTIKEINVPEEVIKVVSDSIDKSIEAVETVNEKVEAVTEEEEEAEKVLTLVDEYKKAYDTLYDLFEPYKTLETEIEELKEQNKVLQDKINNALKDFKLDELLKKARYEKELEDNRLLIAEKTVAYNEAKEKHDAYFAETDLHHYDDIGRDYNVLLYELKIEAAKESFALSRESKSDMELDEARDAYIDATIAARVAREKVTSVFRSKRDEYYGKLTEYENSKPLEMRVTPETLDHRQSSSWYGYANLASDVTRFEGEEKIQRYRNEESSPGMFGRLNDI